LHSPGQPKRKAHLSNSRLAGKDCLTRIFHESEAFIGKAFTGAAVLRYCNPSFANVEGTKACRIQHMEASVAPEGWIFFSAFHI
jgi:hypothetical protein